MSIIIALNFRYSENINLLCQASKSPEIKKSINLTCTEEKSNSHTIARTMIESGEGTKT